VEGAVESAAMLLLYLARLVGYPETMRSLPLLRVLPSVLWLMGMLSAGYCSAQEFQAGTGKADITPTEPVRLAGYAGRTKAFESIDQHLFTKALALKDAQGQTTIIVTADTIGVPRWFSDELAGRLEQELKVPRERVLFACSHSHSAPVIDGALTMMYGLDEAEGAAVKKYTQAFLQASFEAARDAVKSLQPAKLSFGRGEAFFAGNRRAFGPKGVQFGINPNGPVERDVPVLRVDRPDGSLHAVLFGYACHCTTPGATYEVSGDWAGYAQEELERNFPGATALFITGCGADANPNPRGKMLYARAHGLQLSGAVARVLHEPMRAVTGPIAAVFDQVDLPLGPTPDKAYYEAKLTEKAPATQRYAQHHLDKIARGEPLPKSYPAPLQVLRFGEAFTLIALSGEVVVDYSLRLKRELPDERLWNAAYCNEIFAYVPSMRILLEGGYEADSSLIYYNLPTCFAPAVEDALVNKVLGMIKQAQGRK
jgi:neutral ceramidase